jgi:hypothetical protein
MTRPQRGQQYTLARLETAESSTGQLTLALDPLPVWLSSLRPLVSHGDKAATLFAAGSRLVDSTIRLTSNLAKVLLHTLSLS